MPPDDAPTSRSVYFEDAIATSNSTSRTENFLVCHADRKDSVELHRKLTEKFGSKFTEILNKYGAYEYITDENGEILDILPPEDYLAEADDLAKLRFNVGDHDSPHVSITAGALADLAYAEAQYYAVEAEQFRYDPSVIIKHIEEVALHRPECLPDFNGNSPTPESLLGNGRFVGQMLRFAVHNTLGQMGSWSLIVDYLSQAQALDDKHGRFGAEARRRRLMGCAKSLVEQEMEKVEKQVRFGIIFHLGGERLWYREKNHPDYSGAVMAVRPEKESRMTALTKERTLLGAFTRFVVLDRTDFSPAEVEALKVDIFRYLNNAPEEWDKIGSFLAEQLTQLRRLMDFREMLADADNVHVPDDDVYQSFGRALRKSEQVFTKTTLERSIKNIGSLSNANTLRKIWKDIDDIFKKDCKMLAERFIGFRQAAPQWYMPLPVPAPEPQPSTAVESLPAPEPKEKPPRVKRSQRPRAPRAPSPAPADIKPYSYWTEMKLPSTIDDDDLVSKRDGPKVKTRPSETAKQPESAQSDIADQAAQSGLVRATPGGKQTLFWLKKRIYNIVERIFDREDKGEMRWDDFVQAMTHLDFSYDERRAGSRVRMKPLSSFNKPIVLHKPHPETTLNSGEINRNASLLTKTYGWTIHNFALKTSNGEDDDDD